MSILTIVALTIAGTILTILGIFGFILLFLVYGRVATLPALDVRLSNMEMYLRDISEQDPTSDPTAGMIYRTVDGKHSAGSLDELLMKVMNDPTASITTEQKDALQEFLSQIETETSSLHFDDESDEDEDE